MRKSSTPEDKQALSLESQEDESKKIVEFHKLPPFVATFSESKSAKEAYQRKYFSQMMKLIHSGKVDSIVCWKLDRLARNMTEGGLLIDLLSTGVLKAIMTHDKVYYPDDNVLMMAVEFGQGNQFIKDLSVNVKRGQEKKARMGIPHGVATLGFLNDKTEEKGNRKWLVDKKRLGVIKELFEMFLTNTYSAGKLYKHAIKELKLTTIKRKKIGGALITPSRIYEILKDPIYAGFFIQGGIRYELDKSLPRLINEDQHYKIKMILSKKNIPKTQTHNTTFAGFLSSEEGNFIGQDVKFQLICDCKYKFAYRGRTHCPNCGKEIAELENPKYLDFTYYYNVKKKKQQLDYRSISEVKITKELVDYADKNLTFSTDFADWSKKYITELKNREMNDSIFTKQREIADKGDYEAKKARLRVMLRDEQITDEEYRSDLSVLDKQYSVTAPATTGIDWYSRMNEIVDLTVSLKEVLENGTLQAKRNILSKLGSNLIWNDKILSIHNDKAIDKLVEGLNCAKSNRRMFEPKNFSYGIRVEMEKEGILAPSFPQIISKLRG